MLNKWPTYYVTSRVVFASEIYIHGFCSTGSQISWLSESSEQSHFFTAASDPLLAKYKLFTFADNFSEKDDHDSNKLWSIWRSLVLKRRMRLTDNTLSSLSKIEDEALSLLEQKNASNKISFADLIRMEIRLLEEYCVQLLQVTTELTANLLSLDQSRQTNQLLFATHIHPAP